MWFLARISATSIKTAKKTLQRVLATRPRRAEKGTEKRRFSQGRPRLPLKKRLSVKNVLVARSRSQVVRAGINEKTRRSRTTRKHSQSASIVVPTPDGEGGNKAG